MARFSYFLPFAVLATPVSAQTTDEDVWVRGIPGVDGSDPVQNGFVSEETATPPPPLLLPDVTDIQPPEPAIADPVFSAEAELPEPAGPLQIGAIGVMAPPSMDVELFSAAIENFIGREANPDELARLTQQIADIARDEGFIFASAYIPAQSVKFGVVEVKIIEGTIDEVRILGSDNKQLRRIVSRLEGKVAQRGEVERAILLAQDIPELWVRSNRFVQENGRNILEVVVGERKDRIRLEADNYGTRSFGPARARLSGDFNNVLTDADTAGIAIRTNPIEPDEVLSVSGYYQTMVGTDGLNLGIAGSIGSTEPGNANVGAATEGESRYVGAYASYPLARSTDGSLWVEAKAAHLSIGQDQLNMLIREDTQVTVSLGLRGEVPFAGGRLRGGTALVQGLDIFGATRLGDPLASRRDGDGVFTKGEFWMDFRTDLARNIDLYLAARGQLASRPLLATEELSIGGAYRVRGYDFSELSGEDGFYGLAELRYTFKTKSPLIKQLQLYGFVDIGYVNNLERINADGTLISAGPGVRGLLGPVNFELEAAMPINRDRRQSGDRDPHLNVRVGVDF